jgi:hypothetical protein
MFFIQLALAITALTLAGCAANPLRVELSGAEDALIKSIEDKTNTIGQPTPGCTCKECKCFMSEEQLEQLADAIVDKLEERRALRRFEEIESTPKRDLAGYKGYTLDYWTYNGCGACKEFERKSLPKFPDKFVYSINLYEGTNSKTAEALNVDRYPTFILRDTEGVEVNRWVGDPTWEAVKKFIDER